MNSSNKILISGYYGFNNFGDDAILKCIIDCLKTKADEKDITVLSSNPELTALTYNVNSLHSFKLKDVLNALKNCNVFISGGGSILQDKTSLKSLFYYLMLIFSAKIMNKKVCIYAQGIGPINSPIGKILTRAVLKNIDFISVRDELSSKLLSKWNIKHSLTADPAWDININKVLNINKKRAGIQLRNWKALTDQEIDIIAESINNCFQKNETEFEILNLQPGFDDEVSDKLRLKLNKLGIETKIYEYKNIDGCINKISTFDYFIAMRFHCAVISIKAGIPTFLLSYDPKVSSLAQESNLPYCKVGKCKKEEVDEGIKYLINSEQKINEGLVNFSNKQTEIARQNSVLLLRIVENNNI